MQAGKDQSWLVERSGVARAFATFAREKRGTVVFLGGSITEVPGWRDRVCESLRRRFPKTEFRFENSGISSTDSTPGAFRAHRDVCSHGPVDLLFVDAAVNDALNRPGDTRAWLRGMEGIVRHTLLHNPEANIVLLHFADPQKLADYGAEKTPAVIETHERVAQHYGVASLDLAREVFDRIRANEFSWEKDFKDLHPSPFGHGLYAAAVDRLFDATGAGKPSTRPPLPAPMDHHSIFDGRLADFREAERGDGWKTREGWNPFLAVKPGQHAYFQDVPELIAETAGAGLALRFDGRAVGIWTWIGPEGGRVEASIDDGPWRNFEMVTPWSKTIALPWIVMLADDLPTGTHTLRLRAATASPSAPLRIMAFVVNGPARP